VLNYVEIDSTFYRIPSEFMVKNWNRRTPDNFRFNTDKFKTVIPDPFQGSGPLMNQISVIFGPSLNNCDIVNERNLPMSQKLI
jgi:hypothetical protein